MTKYVKSILVLSLIGMVLAFLLGAANAITAPEIERVEKEKTLKALSEVYKTATDFDELDIAEIEGIPSTVTEVYSANDGGFVIKLKTNGYSSDFIILCGISASGEVTGATTISSKETLGQEKTYGAALLGASYETIDSVDTVSHATKTTSAYRDAVKDALLTASLIAENSEEG